MESRISPVNETLERVRSQFYGARVLVTGDTGFTGSWLALWLQRLGAIVQGFSIEERGATNLFGNSKLYSYPTTFGRIENAGLMSETISNFQPQLIIHLAAQPLVLVGFDNPLETFATNSFGTASVLDSAIRQSTVKGILAITTDKVYLPSPTPRMETSMLGGKDPYSASKVAAESIIASYRTLLAGTGTELVSMRGGNIFGGGDWSRYRIVPDLFRSLSTGTSLTLRNPNFVRPWQHVLDLCFAYLTVGSRMLEGNLKLSDAYNVGPENASEVTVFDLVERFGLEVPIILGTESDGKETNSLKLDASLLRKELGWRPILTLDKAIGFTGDWYRGVLFGGESPEESSLSQINAFEELVD